MTVGSLSNGDDPAGLFQPARRIRGTPGMGVVTTGLATSSRPLRSWNRLTSLFYDQMNNNYVQYNAGLGQHFALINEPWGDLWAAHAILGQMPDNYRSWANPSAPQPGDPSRVDAANLSTWHDYLTGGIVEPAAYGPTDIRHLLSVGPVAIPPRSSVVFFTVLASGHSLTDLLTNVAAARLKYSELHGQAKLPHIRPVAVEWVGQPKPSASHLEMLIGGGSGDFAEHFDPWHTFCSGTGPELLARRGGVVFARLSKHDLDPWIDNGDVVVCVGKLETGDLFAGGVTMR